MGMCNSVGGGREVGGCSRDRGIGIVNGNVLGIEQREFTIDIVGSLHLLGRPLQGTYDVGNCIPSDFVTFAESILVRSASCFTGNFEP